MIHTLREGYFQQAPRKHIDLASPLQNAPTTCFLYEPSFPEVFGILNLKKGVEHIGEKRQRAMWSTAELPHTEGRGSAVGVGI